jgi:hypothetical protein
MKTQTFKSMRGWQSVTVIPAPEIGPNRIIEILTMKRSDGTLTSSASVQKVEFGYQTFMMAGDYRVALIVTKTRATEKTVAAQQAQALEMLPQVIERAVSFYWNKQAKQQAA